MKKNYLNTSLQAFTLVEVIITLTILSLIFTSVMSVFIYYTTLWNRVEANRLLQSNVKTVIEQITKDVKNHWINIYDPNYQDPTASDLHKFNNSNKYSVDDTKLFIWWSEYFLWREKPGNPDEYIIADAKYCDITNDETDIENNCRLIKRTPDESIPLTNSWVSIRNLNFKVSEESIPKVTMSFEIGIASWKWLKTNLVTTSYFPVQATISEKNIDQ